MKLAQCLTGAQNELIEAGIDTPALDARLLLCYALKCDRLHLVTARDRSLTANEVKEFATLIARRKGREPVGRILGQRGFWGLEFSLNGDTLEPRPDSETLIEAVLSYGRDHNRILDLGTGTGCLLLALLHEMPAATGIGADISLSALGQAERNGRLLELHSRAEFVQSNWLQNISGRFDVIVSNPPYIRSAEIASLMPEVRNFDPRTALDGGSDGLAPYRLFIPNLAEKLCDAGLVALEVGAGQSNDVCALLSAHGFESVREHFDLADIARCLTARKKA